MLRCQHHRPSVVLEHYVKFSIDKVLTSLESVAFWELFTLNRLCSLSLQRENKELKATAAELHAALESERRRVAALEICLRDAERSRDEAQRRNQELQREIQQCLTREPQAPT